MRGRSEAIVDHPSSQLLVDTRLGEILRANEAAMDFFGGPGAPLGGMRWSELITDLRLVEELRRAVVEQPDGDEPPVTISIGYAGYRHGEGNARFMQRLDRALIAAEPADES